MCTGIEVVGVKIKGVGVAGVVEIVGPAIPSQSPASNLGTKGLAITKQGRSKKCERSKPENKNNIKSRLPVYPPPLVIHNL